MGLRATRRRGHHPSREADTRAQVPRQLLSSHLLLGLAPALPAIGAPCSTAASANAATEMGGTPTACSDGEGRGATFTLELPLLKSASTT